MFDLLTAMSRRGFPVREKEVRILATDYANKNSVTVSQIMPVTSGFEALAGL